MSIDAPPPPPPPPPPRDEPVADPVDQPIVEDAAATQDSANPSGRSANADGGSGPIRAATDTRPGQSDAMETPGSSASSPDISAADPVDQAIVDDGFAPAAPQETANRSEEPPNADQGAVPLGALETGQLSGEPEDPAEAAIATDVGRAAADSDPVADDLAAEDADRGAVPDLPGQESGIAQAALLTGGQIQETSRDSAAELTTDERPAAPGSYVAEDQATEEETERADENAADSGEDIAADDGSEDADDVSDDEAVEEAEHEDNGAASDLEDKDGETDGEGADEEGAADDEDTGTGTGEDESETDEGSDDEDGAADHYSEGEPGQNGELVDQADSPEPPDAGDTPDLAETAASNDQVPGEGEPRDDRYRTEAATISEDGGDASIRGEGSVTTDEALAAASRSAGDYFDASDVDARYVPPGDSEYLAGTAGHTPLLGSGAPMLNDSGQFVVYIQDEGLISEQEGAVTVMHELMHIANPNASEEDVEAAAQWLTVGG